MTDRLDALEQAAKIHGVQIAAMHRILTRVLVALEKTNPGLVEKAKRDYAEALAKAGANTLGVNANEARQDG